MTSGARNRPDVGSASRRSALPKTPSCTLARRTSSRATAASADASPGAPNLLASSARPRRPRRHLRAGATQGARRRLRRRRRLVPRDQSPRASSGRPRVPVVPVPERESNLRPERPHPRGASVEALPRARVQARVAVVAVGQAVPALPIPGRLREPSEPLRGSRGRAKLGETRRRQQRWISRAVAIVHARRVSPRFFRPIFALGAIDVRPPRSRRRVRIARRDREHRCRHPRRRCAFESGDARARASFEPDPEPRASG